jgi:hypothetical protein
LPAERSRRSTRRLTTPSTSIAPGSWSRTSARRGSRCDSPERLGSTLAPHRSSNLLSICARDITL